VGTNKHQKPRVDRFTVTRLATLPAGRYKDPAQESLYLLVRDKRDGTHSRTWVHRIKYQAGDTYLPVGHFPETPLTEARTLVQGQREMLSKGIDPRRASPRRKRARASSAILSPADKHSVEFLAHEFLERHVKPNRKQPAYVENILNRDVLAAGAWRARDARTIKPREVIELLDKIVARGSPVMANRTAVTGNSAAYCSCLGFAGIVAPVQITGDKRCRRRSDEVRKPGGQWWRGLRRVD
jgi:hypothetical protein